MKRIKVLQLIDSLEIGGAEVLALNIHKLLSEEENIDSYICATRKEGPLKSKIKSNYFFLNKKSTFDLIAIIKLRKNIRNNNIQIIHAHSSSYFLASIIKIIYPKIKIVWHDHYGCSDNLKKRNKQPLRFFSSKFSHSIFVNQKLLDWANLNLLVRKKIIVNNFAVLDSATEKTILKGIEGKRIVMVAAFRDQKDHLNLLNSFLIISKFYSDWTLHLIGKYHNNSTSDKIFEFVENNSLQEKVFFYGACNDIKNIHIQSTIGVLSSKSEGLPISLLEYGLCKLPVVITDVGDCSLLVKDNLTGVLVSKENSAELAIGIEVLINSKEKRITFGNNLYKEVITRFSKKKFKKELLNIYKEIN